MSVSLIIFIVSGIGIIVFIGLKMLQERLGILLFWPDARSRLETRLQQRAARVRSFTQTFNKRTLYIVLHYILVKIRSLFSYLQQKIDKRLVHLVNLIKGKHPTEVKGNTSHFLHDINRFKNKFKRH